MMKSAVLLGVLVLAGAAAGAGAAPKDAGRAPYGAWKYGMPSDPSYFPIAVWLQSPRNARRYQAAGINLYIGLWEGPTEAQLAELKAAGMPVICEQNAVGLAHKSDPIIVGWMHGDEPDNAQEVTDANGKKGWGPCVPPARIVADYERIRTTDPTRPVILNLGQGVANDKWVGRGPGAKLSDYETFVKGCDIVSFDVYPEADLNKSGDYLWLVAKGVERLQQWTQGQKVIWNCIECTHIGNAERKASPEQIRAEVWMSLIHGSRGLIYFVHQFAPKFNEWALLDDPVNFPAVTEINRQIKELAPVLNSPTVADGVQVQSSAEGVPIATMVKRYGGATYLFAVGMRNGATHGTFTLKGLRAKATAEALGEKRTLAVQAGRFEDDFKPYEVHLYRVR